MKFNPTTDFLKMNLVFEFPLLLTLKVTTLEMEGSEPW